MIALAKKTDQTQEAQIVVTATDPSGVSVTDNFIVTYTPCTSAIKSTEGNFELYPNPATNFVTVLFTEASPFRKAEIYSIKGQKLISANFTERSNKLSLEGLDKGNYTLIIRNKNQAPQRRTIIRQ